MPPAAAAGPALCLACNAASAGLLWQQQARLHRLYVPQRPSFALLLLLSTAVALTAVQHWTATSEFDDDEDGSGGPNLVVALQLLLSLAACRALAPPPAAASSRQQSLLSLIGCLAVLLPLAQLDALALALLCAASLALHAAERQKPLLLPMAAPIIALLWVALAGSAAAKDELLGAPAEASWWPDSGTWWYMRTETFHGFQAYFRLVLAAHPFLYLAPMAIRVAGSKPGPTGTAAASPSSSSSLSSPGPVAEDQRRQMFLLTALAIGHVFRPRPLPAHIAATVGAFLLRLPPPTLHGLRYKLLLCGVGLGVPLVLMPVMAHLWLRARAGNANYLFFQGYVWNVFWSFVLLEMVLALVKLDDGRRRGKTKEKQRTD